MAISCSSICTLFLVALAFLLQVSVAQSFVVPPAQNGNFSVGEAAKLAWNCDFQNIDLILWSQAKVSNGQLYQQKLLTNQPNGNAFTFTPNKSLPLGSGGLFHLEVREIDPTSGQSTGNNFNSAIFSVSAASPPASKTSSSPTAAATTSMPAAPTTGSMPDGHTIGAAVGAVVGVLCLAVAVTGGIWYNNRRERRLRNRRYTDYMTAVDHQEPFPVDPRLARRALGLPSPPASPMDLEKPLPSVPPMREKGGDEEAAGWAASGGRFERDTAVLLEDPPAPRSAGPGGRRSVWSIWGPPPPATRLSW